MVRGAWCVVRGAWCVVRGPWCVGRGAWAVGRGADLRRLFLFAGLGSSELTLQPGPISPGSVPVMAWTQSRVTAYVSIRARRRRLMRAELESHRIVVSNVTAERAEGVGQ